MAIFVKLGDGVYVNPQFVTSVEAALPELHSSPPVVTPRVDVTEFVAGGYGPKKHKVYGKTIDEVVAMLERRPAPPAAGDDLPDAEVRAALADGAWKCFGCGRLNEALAAWCPCKDGK